MDMKLISIGRYKQKDVYIIEHKKTKSWSIILRHKRFGDLRVDDLDYRPRIGMAKRYFRDWLRKLNEEELERNNGERVYNEPEEQIRVTPEEIKGWLNE